MHGTWLTGWVVSISWQWCQRPCCHHSHRPHPVPSIRPQSPYSFLSVLEDNHTSGLCHFTEIMRFLNVKANLYHLEGPKYIPKPDKKLFLDHTLFGIIHCFKLSGSCVSVTLGHVWVLVSLVTTDPWQAEHTYLLTHTSQNPMPGSGSGH